MDNLKAFLEADAPWSDGIVEDNEFAYLADSAVSDIRALQDAFEQVCEGLGSLDDPDNLGCTRSTAARLLRLAAPFRKTGV